MPSRRAEYRADAQAVEEGYADEYRQQLTITTDSTTGYNTYKYAGLPPGPISCPPKSCLEAVLHPDTHNYLYFCADPSFNGTHRFASSYSEHLSNARAFQKALTERQKSSAR